MIRFYRELKAFLIITMGVILAPLVVYAQSVPGSFVYQGQITKAGGIPLEANPVVFTVRVYSPVNDCLLYEEQHSINMLGSEGTFSLNMGVGIRSGSNFEDTSNLAAVMQNGMNYTGITSCSSGTSYNALLGHTRKVRVSYDDGSGPVTIAQDFHIQAVPYAWYANSLQGLTPSNFVQINPGQNVTQSNLENLLGGTNYNTLYNLASGTSSSPLSLNNQQIKNLADPTLAQDAATKNYADTRVGGSLVNLSGVGSGIGDGRVLAWNATLNQWEATTPSSITDSTKLPLTGGTMSGNINMGGNQVLNTGHVTMQNLATITLGKYSTAQESTLVGTLTVSNKGATWYNSTTDKIMYWDGDSAEVVGNGSATGDIEEIATAPGSGLSGGVASGTATLAVMTDNSTIEVNGLNQLQVKDNGVTDAKINSVSVSKITSGLGQYLTYNPNGGSCLLGEVLKLTLNGWECGTDNNTGGVISVFGRSGAVTAQSGDYTATQVTNIPAGTISATTTQAALNELDTEKVNKSGDTMTGALTVPADGFTVGATQLVATAGNVGVGTAAPSTRLDVEGTLQIGDGGETCSIAANAGMIKYAAGALQYCNGSAWQTLGVSGAGLTTLNGQTGSTQSFAVDGTGTAPSINSASNVHTLSIPLASGVGVTSGTISKADYDLFTAKLSSVSGSTLSSGLLWVGNVSNQAAAVAMSGDATLSNTGALTISNNAVTAAKISADAITSSKILDGTIATADIADGAVTDTKINAISVNKITSSLGQYLTYSPNGAACAIGEVLKLTVNGWECGTDNNSGGVTTVFGRSGAVTAQAGDYTATQITNTPAGAVSATTTQAAINELDTEKVNKSGDTMTGSLVLPSNGLTVGTTQLVVTGGSVGIGTATPASKLDVEGAIQVGDAGETCSIAANAGMIKYASGTLQYCNGSAWQTLGVSGAGLTSLNGQTGSTQVFAVDTTGTAPSINSGSNIHTLSIPLASGIGVTSGTISKADYDAFAAKLSSVSGSTLNSGLMWVGNGSNQATAVSMSGDATLSNTGALTISNNAVTTAKINADAVTSAKILDGSVATADIANSAVTDAKIATVSVNKITSSLGQYLTYNPNGAACAIGEVLKLTVNGWECGTDNNSGGVTTVFGRSGAVTPQSGDYSAAQITNTPAGAISATTTQAAINELDTEKVNKSGDTMTGALSVPVDGFTIGASQFVATGGNVGIGTATPSSRLDIEGTIQIGDGGETCSMAANAGMIKYASGALQYCNGSAWQTLGVSGAGLTTLNGQTGSTQTFAVTATGTAPAINSATNTHTLSIPLASGVGVTSGTISKADYDAFTAKLSSVSGSTLNSGLMWVGNGSNQAAAVSMSGDATLSNTGALTIANSAINSAKLGADAVTSAKILDGSVATVDIANSAVTDAKIATVSVNKITSALGQYFTYDPNGGACAIGEVLKKTINGWECGTDSGGVTDHGLLGGLSDDDHTQYVMLAGRTGGQNLRGGTAANNNLTLESTSDATKGHVLLQPNGGNVGIGTTSPSEKLDVVGRQMISGAGEWPMTIRHDAVVSTFRTHFVSQRSTSGGTVMSGNTLGGIAMGGRYDGTTFSNGWDGGAEISGVASENWSSTNRGADLSFLTVNNGATSVTEKMRITAGGNVGIGTTSPLAPLNVYGFGSGTSVATTGTADATMNFRAARGVVGVDIGMLDNGTGYIQNRNITALGTTYNLAIQPTGGNVGIGLTNPTYQLQLSTDSAAKPGTSTWTIASDERLKDIRAPFTRGLDAINGLNTIYFNYKKDNPLELPSEKEYVGIKAQDAQRVIPEAVSTDEQGYLHVTNDSIIWTAVNAIKELYAKFLGHDVQLAQQARSIASKADKAVVDAKVQQLEAKNKQLEQDNAKKTKELEEVKARLDKIEKMLNSK